MFESEKSEWQLSDEIVVDSEFAEKNEVAHLVRQPAQLVVSQVDVSQVGFEAQIIDI